MRLKLSFDFEFETEPPQSYGVRHGPPDDRLSDGPRWGSKSQSGLSFETRPHGGFTRARIGRTGWVVAEYAAFIFLVAAFVAIPGCRVEAIMAVIALPAGELVKRIVRRWK